MKRLGFYFLAALLLMGCAARRSAAQFIGYTSPQTVSQTLLNTSSFACDSTLHFYPTQNLGQTVHSLFYTVTLASGQTAQFYLQGSIDGTNYQTISDVGIAVPSGAVIGAGYYPAVRAAVVCFGGSTATIQLNYAGTSVTAAVSAGVVDEGAFQKFIFNAAAANNSQGIAITPTPYGNTSGVIYFVFKGAAGPAGSTISVACVPGGTGGGIGALPVTTLATTQDAEQSFPIAALPCEYANVTYTPGGASAATINAWYYFSKPGALPPSSSSAPSSNVNISSIGGNPITTTVPVSGSVTATVSGSVNATDNLTQVAGSAISLGQKAMANSLPVVLASDESPISVTPPSTDPCQAPGVAKNSVAINIGSATTTSLVGVSGSTSVYVCGFTVNILGLATTAGTIQFEFGSGASCTGPTALTGTMAGTTTAGTQSTISYAPGHTAFKGAASSGICAVTTGASPSFQGVLTYVQQ